MTQPQTEWSREAITLDLCYRLESKAVNRRLSIDVGVRSSGVQSNSLFWVVLDITVFHVISLTTVSALFPSQKNTQKPRNYPKNVDTGKRRHIFLLVFQHLWCTDVNHSVTPLSLSQLFQWKNRNGSVHHSLVCTYTFTLLHSLVVKKGTATIANKQRAIGAGMMMMPPPNMKIPIVGGALHGWGLGLMTVNS